MGFKFNPMGVIFSRTSTSSGGSGVDTLAAVGSSPNANAATITGTTLNLQPASASFPGLVTTGTQAFGGAKQFSSMGINAAATTGSFHVKANGTNYDSGLTLESNSGSHKWNIYPETNGFIYFRNVDASLNPLIIDNTAKVSVGGGSADAILSVGKAADAVQFSVKSHSTQTSNLAQFKDTAGTVKVHIDGTGKTFLSALQVADGTQSNGYILTSDGSGNATWQANSGSGANTSLSNLTSPTAINQVLGDSSGIDSLQLTTRQLIRSTGETSVNYEGLQLIDSFTNVSYDWSVRTFYGSEGNPALDHNTRYAYDSNGSQVFTWSSGDLIGKDGAQFNIRASQGSGGGAQDLTLNSGADDDDGNAGTLYLNGGNSATGIAGSVRLRTGSTDSNTGGQIDIYTVAPTTDGNVGELSISTESANGTGNGGNINIITNAPSGSGTLPNININSAGFLILTAGTTSLTTDTFQLTNDNTALSWPTTITTPGTTGAQTINKITGSVNFAAADTSLVVTSDKVSTSSIIIATVQTNDTTLKSVQCIPSSGSFTMYANAAATAETRVCFLIINQ